MCIKEENKSRNKTENGKPQRKSMKIITDSLKTAIKLVNFQPDRLGIKKKKHKLPIS